MTTDESRNMKDISASEYIRSNFHPSDRIAVLVRNGGTGETIQRIATAELIARTPCCQAAKNKRARRHSSRAAAEWRRSANALPRGRQ